MIRSDVLTKSLNNLRAYLKSLSLGKDASLGNSLGVPISPLLGGRKNLHLWKAIDTPQIRRTPKSTTGGSTGGGGIGDNWQAYGLMRKIHDKSIDMLGGGTKSQPVSNTGPSGDSKDPLDTSVSVQEIFSYATCVTGLFKLMQLELRLLEIIIPREHQRTIFSRLVIKALDSIFQEGDNLSTSVKRSVLRHDFSSALCLLPVLRYHAHMRHNFDILLDGCEADVQNKLHSLVVTLQTTISKSLEEFIEYIKSDIHTRVPKDGTVHELTSNVMLFLVDLQSYLDILSRVVTVTDFRSMELCPDKNRVAYAQYITRVLSALGLTLRKKSEAYNNDPCLQALFRLNNTHYILRTLRKSSLLEIVHLFNTDIEAAYEDQIRQHKREYFKSWDKVLHHIVEGNTSHHRGSITNTSTMPSSMSAYSLSAAVGTALRLKDKDRQNIKDKFFGFNKEFETLRATQTGYAIPDMGLREELKRENVQYIVPKYAIFYEKYIQVDFTKNVHKYIKYTPDHVAQAISSFFDSAA